MVKIVERLGYFTYFLSLFEAKLGRLRTVYYFETRIAGTAKNPVFTKIDYSLFSGEYIELQKRAFFLCEDWFKQQNVAVALDRIMPRQAIDWLTPIKKKMLDRIFMRAALVQRLIESLGDDSGYAVHGRWLVLVESRGGRPVFGPPMALVRKSLFFLAVNGFITLRLLRQLTQISFGPGRKPVRIVAEVHDYSQISIYDKVLKHYDPEMIMLLADGHSNDSGKYHRKHVSELKTSLAEYFMLLAAVVKLNVRCLRLVGSAAFVDLLVSCNQALHYYWRALAIVSTCRPEVFLSIDEWSSEAMVRNEVLCGAGAAGINLMHGEKSYDHFNAYCNYECYCINGPAYRQYFDFLGGRVKRYEVTGSLLHDDLYIKKRNNEADAVLFEKRKTHKILAVFSTGVCDLNTPDLAGELFVQAYRYLEATPDVFLVFKLHPDEYHDAAALQRYGLTHERLLLVKDEIATPIIINQADLVVTSYSTVGIESIMMGAKTVYLNIGNKLHVFDYDGYGEQLVVKNEGEIKSAFDSYLLDGQAVVPKAVLDKIKADRVPHFDGGNHLRVKKVIDGYLKDVRQVAKDSLTIS